MSKIAFATDDGQLISRHYGRAQSFLVVTVEGGHERFRELRPKANHAMFVADGKPDPTDGGVTRGDGQRRHDMMLGACWDCEAVVVRGIGTGAFDDLAEAGIRVIATNRERVNDAVEDWVVGRLRHHPELVHAPSGMGPGRHVHGANGNSSHR